jgi:hypothetical protein
MLHMLRNILKQFQRLSVALGSSTRHACNMERKKNPAGSLIDARATLAGGSALAADTKQRGRIETRQRAVEEFEQLVAASATLPKPMATIVASCARDGIRRRQGRGGAYLSQAEKLTRETAMQEVPELLRNYRAEANATGKPRGWAREETAKAVHRRMKELGSDAPPAVATIRKWKF